MNILSLNAGLNAGVECDKGGIMTGNLGDPVVSSARSRPGDRVNNSGPRRRTRPPGSEENEWTRRYRQAKETKCGETGGRKS